MSQQKTIYVLQILALVFASLGMVAKIAGAIGAASLAAQVKSGIAGAADKVGMAAIVNLIFDNLLNIAVVLATTSLVLQSQLNGTTGDTFRPPVEEFKERMTKGDYINEAWGSPQGLALKKRIADILGFPGKLEDWADAGWKTAVNKLTDPTTWAAAVAMRLTLLATTNGNRVMDWLK
jgi:hypothetical protein